jgi:hypothetical protein
MNAMKSERFWLVGGALAVVLVAAVAWFGAVGPQLSHASSLESQTTDAQTQNISLHAKIRKLQQDNANMPVLTASLQQARTALPIQTDIAGYTKRLSDYATNNHVVITGINASVPVSATAKPGQPAAAAAGSAAGQLFALPLTVIVKGNALDDLKYLLAVQADPRAALVTSTQLANDASNTGSPTQLTIQLQVFVAPQTPEVTAALLRQLTPTSK